MIKKLSEAYPVRRICKLLGISKSAYYNYVNGQTYGISELEENLQQEVRAIFNFHKRRYGSRRIQSEMVDKGYEIGRYQVRRLMKVQELQAIQPKSFVPKTTISNPSLRRSPNLLLSVSFPTAPNQIIVGDITYLPLVKTAEKDWLYLAIWLDLFSRKIVGWQIDDNMEASLIISALQQVIRNRKVAKGLIVHSDGGGQYGATDFRELIALNEFRQSMTRKDNHYDNAFAESLFSRFKAELLDGGCFTGLKSAKLEVFEYIEGYYNTIRKHSSLGYKSPTQYEEQYWNTRE